MATLINPRINYVSAPPGIGKTRAAVNYMVAHIEAATSGQPVGYIFYVFPSHDLGKQTRNNLKSMLPEHYHRFLFHVGSDEELQSNRDNTDQKVYNILNDHTHKTKGGKFGARPFLPGSILFMAHPTFLKLRKHPKFKHTTVIFDEARSWVTIQRKMDLSGENNRKYFERLFTQEPVLKNGKPHSYLRVLTPKKLSKDGIEHEGIYATDTTIELDALHKQLRPGKDDQSRMRVYSFKRGNKLVQITMPYYPFVGFKRVIILAADFEQSQMFHLLKLERARMKACTEDFIDTYTPTGYWGALKIIHDRTRRLRLLPLLAEPGVGSKYQFHRGIVLPEHKFNELSEALNELGLSSTSIQQLVQYIRDPEEFAATLTPAHYKLLRAMESIGVKVDILEWMIHKSVEELQKWREKYPSKRPAILFVNKAYEDKYPADGFVYMKLGKAEGKNEYMHSNVVAFLAAVNPDQDTAELLHTLLPDYDVDEDYVINKAVQCIGRGNIRNHESKRKMLAIVPTEGIAERVLVRLKGAPRIIPYARANPKRTYRFWSAHVARSISAGTTTKEGKKASDKNAYDKYKENPFNKRLVYLRNKRSRLNRTLERKHLTKQQRHAILTDLENVRLEIEKTESERNKANTEE